MPCCKSAVFASSPLLNTDLPTGTKLILVASAALISPTGKLLLAQRVGKKFLAGSWEFPGGKVLLTDSSACLSASQLSEVRTKEQTHRW